MLKLALPLAFALLAPAAAAQCFESAFGTALGTPAILIGDIQLPIQPIGFAFPLAGATYTDVHITDKGYVWLSNAGLPAPGGVDFSATAGELASQGPRIAALWSDLQSLAANNGQIYINSTPSRCVITWENTTCYLNNCGPFTMQLQMMATGEVSFFWGPGATNNSTTVPVWQVGVCGISPGAVPLPAASNLSTNGVTIDNTLVEEWLAPNTFDMASRGLHLVPTSPGWVFQLPANCAGTQAYGIGCIQANDSIYEEWVAGFDLNNSTVTWLRAGNGYALLTSIPGTFVTPSLSAINIATGQLDGEQVVTLSGAMPTASGPTTTLNITTKGQIEVASTTNGGVDFTPSVPELLNGARTTFALWHDYDQTDLGSGLILFEQIAGIAYITWNGVHSFSSSVPSTFQFQFDVATGNVALVIGTMGGFASPDNGILGYSVGGPSPNPGSTDFSALAGVINLGDVGLAGLALAATGQPQVGNASFALATSNVPNLVPIGILFFGSAVVNPGLDLSFLGMPGCFAYTNGNLASGSFPVALPAGTGSFTLAIPNNPGLVGVSLSAQSLCFTLATPFNLASSNGLQINIGL